MKLIVGLGNPGEKYAETRHNIGFMVLDQLAKKLNISITESQHRGLLGRGKHKSEAVCLLKPMTFMNLSGESVRPVMDYYKISMDDLLVIYDELDLPYGIHKLRQKGGSGGHNGMKSLIQHLGTQEFKRIRCGIGKPEHGDIIHHVLGRFNQLESETLGAWIDQLVLAAEGFLEEEDFSKVMNRFN